ncbi:arginine--tRNA ligase [Mesomycoplasma lagogenitalium]|uniref:Arginine--tRNA ligase n=1 Tax=Mesomycoplasma lagogenitalium TaxID=171286 RepID=A0ABY8LTR9_9BACT|nr:arginine--tRNA ligase [Mesomycoplasma lagogenitalium]WGI36634.1 arginine--tRNA ligase [Mesomycoplasma lagogenitalium]
MNTKDQIISAIKQALNKLSIDKQIILTEPKNFGDYSTNIALTLKNQLNKNPLEIANLIVTHIDKEKYFIEKIEIAKPGFINFFVKNNIFVEQVNEINEKGLDYGKLNQNQKINIEFVSVNPTGFLHLGHARGAAVGATLANVLEFAGNKVFKEYYINDAGNQIDLLAISVFTRYLQHFKKDVKMPENSYIGQDIVWVAHVIIEKYRDKFVSSSFENEEVRNFFKNASVFILMNQIKKDLKLLGIEFDKFASEKLLYKENKIQQALSKLKGTYEKDGALWLKTSDFGDDKDRVLIKKDGSYTYFLPDIAYHNQKFLDNGGVDKLIDVWGADHIGYIKRMEIALSQLGYDSKNDFKVLTCQIVRLMKDGQELKMSKRKGITFTARELVHLVGKDAVRFFMIDRSENSGLDFDVEIAKENSQKNPVFMVQYAYARANQLLNKGKYLNQKASKISEALAIKLINVLKDFPELIKKISVNYKINLISEYLIKLAKEFNSFYSNVKIINSKNETSLLALVKATKTVLEIAMKLIGVSTPERM